MKTIHERAKALRTKMRLSQAEVADTIQMRRSSYNQFELGKQGIMAAHLFRFAQLCRKNNLDYVSMDYLFNGEIVAIMDEEAIAERIKKLEVDLFVAKERMQEYKKNNEALIKAVNEIHSKESPVSP